MYMHSEVIEVRVTPPVGTVVINRPDRCNALSLAMVDQLQQAIGDLHQQKSVRAVVITGAGDTFCAGRDLVEMAAIEETDSEAEHAHHEQWGREAADCCEMVVDLLSLPKPLIAAVNGPVAGLGVALVLASDVALAASNSTLGVPDTHHGLVSGVVAPLLAYRTGAGTAARLLVSGEMMPAEEIYRLGIYHELVPHELLWARAAEIGNRCAAGAPQAIGLTKRLLLETFGEKLFTDLTSGAVASATARTTAAAREGLRAFVEKRTPEWE